MSQYTENLKIALYSEQGAYKTRQIGHLIREFGHENVGIISCEHGLTTIASQLDQRYIREVDTLKGLREAHKWAIENFTRPDQFICIDGGSRVLDWIKDDVFGGTEKVYLKLLDGKKHAELEPAERVLAMFVTKDMQINTQGQWIKVASIAEQMMNAFVKLPSSSYWTFWEQLTNIDQFTKGPPYRPDTPGAGVFDKLKGVFDFIFRLTKENKKAIAWCDDGQPRKFYCKRRDDQDGGFKIEDKYEDFNLAEFVKFMRGGDRTTQNR